MAKSDARRTRQAHAAPHLHRLPAGGGKAHLCAHRAHAEQGVVVDPTGKLAGRGAYVHRSLSLLGGGAQGWPNLEQALRTKLTPG
jgi:predicted RNA-binding protein YlxR (DUF448 family)